MKVAIEKLAVLLCIHEVLNSNLMPEKGHLSFFFYFIVSTQLL
jgi:hypothetical protein